MKAIGKIEKLPLRTIWEHEALDFTKWLVGNIDALGDAIGIKLSGAEREHRTENFSVDIVADDEDGNPVVIENQLEKSNHDHLGKIITYLSAVDAKTAIWIVSDARAEHVGAVSWLNSSAEAEIYLVKVEAVKIGSSDPAPLFTLIVGPSAATKKAGETKKEFKERYRLRYDFWEKLLEIAKSTTKLHAGVSPGKYSWLGTGAGKAGLSYNYGVTIGESKVELYIDRGKEKDEENKQIFETLKASQKDIETAFGNKLEWERLDDSRASRIAYYIEGLGYRDSDNWSEMMPKLVEAMIRLEKAISPFIKKLEL